ncbi:amidohydrolase [Solibacillus sp. FSL K6-1523]|uniref:amidohydrolase n=1 Tax=Solibacillus sp. FSL K6-1523 TaxID=2921471 RepID=UPI0030FC3D70
MGLAKILVNYKEQLHGNVLFVFQHAEEKPPGGAKEMIAQNILDEVDYVFAAHLDSSLPVGKIAVGSGYKLAAVDYFNIALQGQGGHGASPHEAKDALVVGAELVGSLQKIVSRTVNPLKSAVVSIGQFHSGTAFNVIAETATIEGTVRTYEESVRHDVKQRIENITKGIALAHNVNFEIDYLLGYPALFNDEEQTKIVRTALAKQLLKANIVEMNPSMGAEDFAYFLKERPGTFIKVGSRNEQIETQFAHHHGSFDIDERALKNIQKAFLVIVDEYLL